MVLSRDCLGFVKCAQGELKRKAQFLFSAAAILFHTTSESPEQFVLRLLLFHIIITGRRSKKKTCLQQCNNLLDITRQPVFLIMNCCLFKLAFCSLMQCCSHTNPVYMRWYFCTRYLQLLFMLSISGLVEVETKHSRRVMKAAPAAAQLWLL